MTVQTPPEPDVTIPFNENIDLYILDQEFRRIDVIDIYQSLIWSERSVDFGDFEFVIIDTPEIRTRMPLGSWVTILQSERTARVESFESKISADGERIITYKGTLLEAILLDRPAMPDLVDLTTMPKWVIGPDTPGNIVRQIFETVVLNGGLDSADILEFLQPGTVNTPGGMLEPTDLITVSMELSSVFEQIKPICEAYGLGFRIVRREPRVPMDPITFHFEVYTGTSRTSSDIDVESVIFGEEFDTLTNITEVQSIANEKNVAYVFAMHGTRIVYADGVDPTISGFDRHALYVNGSDISTAAGSALNAEMEQRGKEALAQQRSVIAFDGEIPQSSRYRYRINYDLCDRVEVRSSANLINQMYITEQIFVSDAEGVRSYPTLSFYRLITPGSWSARSAERWDDITSEVWADLE